MSAVRDISAADIDWVLAENARNEVETSVLDKERLAAMIAAAFCATAVGEADAYLIAFDQDADYGSPNFLWFKANVPRFAYVDRVVVAEHARRRGLARALYLDLFDAAQKAGHDRVVCEVNFDPPNPTSDKFHADLGFEEIHRVRLENGKGVRYLQVLLSRTSS